MPKSKFVSKTKFCLKIKVKVKSNYIFPIIEIFYFELCGIYAVCGLLYIFTNNNSLLIFISS